MKGNRHETIYLLRKISRELFMHEHECATVYLVM